MEWISQHLFATISGWDLLVWAAAYAAWRYLTASGGQASVEGDAASNAGTERAGRSRQPRVLSEPAGRWEHRDRILQKQHESVAHRQEQRRRTQRAA